MHQSHNIPWHLIEANFQFLSQYKGSWSFLRSYFPKDNPHHDISRDLKHFIAKFVSTIRSFSETERSKYPERIAPLGRGKIFPDMLREKYPNYLNERNQRIEFWVHCFQAPSTSGWLALQPVINVLLYENEMEALIMLAQHPDINLREPMLEQEEWYQHGFNRTKELSLSAYIFFCSAQAIGTLENGEYALDREYHCLVDQMMHFLARSSEQIAHLELRRDIGEEVNGFNTKDIRVHKDHERFQRYLKDLFALLYRYDMFARECGIDPEWEKELAGCYPLRGHVKAN